MGDLATSTIAALMRLASLASHDWEETLQDMLLVTSGVLSVARVSYWRFREDPASIVCELGYDTRGPRFERGFVLRDTDAASMAASIELRTPLVDQVLVEHASQLSDRDRYLPLGQKSILRQMALRGINSEFFELRKRPFVLPYDRWLRRRLSKIVDPLMRDPVAIAPTGLNPEAVSRLWQAFLDGAPIYWSRVWAIYVLIWWCHRHKVYL